MTLLTIRHNNSMVFGSKIRLCIVSTYVLRSWEINSIPALACPSSGRCLTFSHAGPLRNYEMYIPFVDMGTSAVAADKADSLDAGVVTDGIHGRHCTVNDVENARGQTGTVTELGDNHGCAGIALRRLDDERVSCCDSHGNRPQGNHPESRSA